MYNHLAIGGLVEPNRTVRRVSTAHRQLEGGGFPVRRPFPSAELRHIDPFLMLDEMGPVDWPPGQALGAPDHPHRGFETVTYLLSGEMMHEDSTGRSGYLRPGDVQWMTAGDGVIHSELPTPEFKRRGGRSHGFQLWVNLPRAHKRTAPRYQEVLAQEIPEATSADGLATARVIAGTALGISAVIDTFTPIQYVHWTLEAGADVTQPVPADHTGFIYVFEGSATVAGTDVAAGQVAELGPGADVELASAQGAQLLALTGVPLREPVVQYGPFVMSTREEIVEAIEDFQSGRMGRISRD